LRMRGRDVHQQAIEASNVNLHAPSSCTSGFRFIYRPFFPTDPFFFSSFFLQALIKFFQPSLACHTLTLTAQKTFTPPHCLCILPGIFNSFSPLSSLPPRILFICKAPLIVPISLSIALSRQIPPKHVHHQSCLVQQYQSILYDGRSTNHRRSLRGVRRCFVRFHLLLYSQAFASVSSPSSEGAEE